jgi:hypothetical protein
MQMAALFFYDLDVAAIQRYCAWCYTGTHKRWEELLYWCRYILFPKTYNKLRPTFITGTPTRLMSHEKNTYEQFKCYSQHGNLANINEHPKLVKNSD